MTKIFKESELILSPDHKIYHLDLLPQDIADDIIVVGDPGRVPMVSKYFDSIELRVQHRELVTHTGYLNGKRVTVLSTGMGPDNIDIVLNELDALANIDFTTRMVKPEHRKLNIIRLGTSGALQANIPIDSFVVSEYGAGIDGVLHFYKKSTEVIDWELTRTFIEQTAWPNFLPSPYIVPSSIKLLEKIAFDMIKGITATAPGFFGPQGRELRGELAFPEINEKLSGCNLQGRKITNFEMETSALYGLGKVFEHETLTICVIIANRILKKFSKDYQPRMEQLIQIVLERITK